MYPIVTSVTAPPVARETFMPGLMALSVICNIVRVWRHRGVGVRRGFRSDVRVRVSEWHHHTLGERHDAAVHEVGATVHLLGGPCRQH